MTREFSRVEFICDDSRLGRVLRAISVIGGIYELRSHPVVNAKAQGRKLGAKSSGDLLENFARWLKVQDGNVTPAQVRDFCTEQGRQPSSYSYLLTKAIAAGLLTKVGNGKGKHVTYKARSKAA